MSEIKLLIQGYARKTKNGWQASSAIVLVRDSGRNILVDPGSNTRRLLSALAREGLKPADIDLIFLTHFHLDHILNIRLFPHAAVVDGDTVYVGDAGRAIRGKIPGTEIAVLETPGHAHEHAALIVRTKKGRVAVAGDCFWWWDYEPQKTDERSLLYKKDPFVKNWRQLLSSRKKLLSVADWIIPGHGKMFKVKR